MLRKIFGTRKTIGTSKTETSRLPKPITTPPVPKPNIDFEEKHIFCRICEHGVSYYDNEAEKPSMKCDLNCECVNYKRKGEK